MSANLEPGRVYRGTIEGIPDVLMLADDEGGVVGMTRVRGFLGHPANSVTNIRPQVVLDLENWHPATVASFCSQATGKSFDMNVTAFKCWLADQIAAQAKPYRIPQPARAARVTATLASTADRHWFLRIKGDGSVWVDLTDGNVYDWDDLIDPILVREGICEAVPDGRR